MTASQTDIEWVSSAKPGRFEHGYAIVRIDEFLLPTAPLESCISVKAVLDDADEAEREVVRLNHLAGEGIRYFCQTTRLKRASDAGSVSAGHAANEELRSAGA
ncbi:MAG TPA: hypothetical protein VNH11_16345 [Pirellulales bacterium]|nr:hypothetical protein [Pirellulales bacterium]HVA47941.1 hypothetical protein [Pirellulales bacterium]